MLAIRPSKAKDSAAISKLIEELDLAYPSQSLDDFWVAEKDGKIAGIARLEDLQDFLFLSSVGVDQNLQKQGIASRLVKELLKRAGKKVYLYTTIPRFFEKFGFKTTPFQSFLPSQRTFSCRECTPESCACMVKLPDAA